MIPNIQPPPLWLPQGWSPNALGPTPAVIVQDVVNNITEPEAQSVLLSAGFGIRTTNITAAQVKAINATPIVVVPGIPGSIIIPIFGASQSRCASVTWNATVNANLVYTGGALLQSSLLNLVSLNQAPGDIREDRGSVGFASSQTIDARGVGVQLESTGIPTAGDFVGGFMRVTIVFYVVTPNY